MTARRARLALVLGLCVSAAGLLVGLGVKWGGEGEETSKAPMDELLDEVDEAPLVDADAEILFRRDWDLPVTRNARVDYWVEFLRGRNHEHTRRWLERAGRYGPVILPALRERGMPEDLIYLAMIESGFSTRAYSRAHAVGIWQFIAPTGRRYGLEITQYVDERRDPIRSTEAALDYLEELYGRFGSWYLAAAAYNTGENRIERILRERAGGRRGDDALYWRISPHIPRETRDYVPLMLAAGHIGKDPERYGFKGVKPMAPLAYEEVTVPGATGLRAVATAAEADARVVADLNPHLLRGMTPPGRSWRVRIPVGASETFARNFPRIPESERRALATHQVRRGETLSHMAVRYGTTVAAIRAANGGIDPRRIRVGQRLEIPVGTIGEARPVSPWTYYQVRRGDTLWAIARRHNVTVRELQAWNGMRGRTRILPGQRLRIRA